MKPILKINLDELDKSQLNQLSKFLFGIGKSKIAMQVEAYINGQGLNQTPDAGTSITI